MLGNKWREESGKIGKNGGFFLLKRNGACSWRIPQTTHFLFTRAHVWTRTSRSGKGQRFGTFATSARTPPSESIARWAERLCCAWGEDRNFCKIQNNVSVYDGVELGDYVFCGRPWFLPMCSGRAASIRRRDISSISRRRYAKAPASVQMQPSCADTASAGMRLLQPEAWSQRMCPIMPS